MKSLRLLIAIPMAVVWLVATRGVCEAKAGLELTTSFLLNVQPVVPLPTDRQWLLVSRLVVRSGKCALKSRSCTRA
jgi:hypothetical protein